MRKVHDLKPFPEQNTPATLQSNIPLRESGDFIEKRLTAADPMSDAEAMQEMSDIIAQKEVELKQMDDFDNFLAWVESTDFSSAEIS